MAGGLQPQTVRVGDVPEPDADLAHPGQTPPVQMFEDGEQNVSRETVQAELVVVDVPGLEFCQGGAEAGGGGRGAVLGGRVTVRED